MGSPSHLKRLAMPRSWPLPRKTNIWVTRARSGAHALERCMPINVVLRDVLGVARSTREVRRILHEGLVKVDGRVVKDNKRGVGLMDVLSVGDDDFDAVFSIPMENLGTAAFLLKKQPTRFAESKTKSPLRAEKHNSIFMMVEIFSQIAHPNTKLVTRSRFHSQTRKLSSTLCSVKARNATWLVVFTSAACLL